MIRWMVTVGLAYLALCVVCLPAVIYMYLKAPTMDEQGRGWDRAMEEELGDE